MMKSDVLGKSLVVLLMGESAEGQDDWAVLSGTLQQNASGFFLDRGTEAPFEIQPEWIERIRPVDSDVKDILLDAEHYLPLSLGSIPEGESTVNYLPAGLNWPK